MRIERFEKGGFELSFSLSKMMMLGGDCAGDGRRESARNADAKPGKFKWSWLSLAAHLYGPPQSFWNVTQSIYLARRFAADLK